MEKILEVKNIKKIYDNFMLDDISFSLERGYIMGFIGTNGSGKTTTIKLIMNLLNKDGGNITIAGLDNIQNEKEAKSKIGFVYDNSNFYQNMSIYENAKIISEFYDKWSWSDFNKYLDLFKLDSKMKIKKLSKGMKMKFSIALAMSHDAELLIMDEPTSGLDLIARQQLIDILMEYIEDGKRSVLFSTHILSDIEKMADYVTLIDNGRIVFSDEKFNIEDKYRIVKGGLELLNGEIEKNFISIKKNKYGFSGLTTYDNSLKLKSNNSVVIDNPSLEDLMLFLVGEDDARNK